MNANSMIFQLEGLVGNSLRGDQGTKDRQYVSVWLDLMKALVRSTELREATDWAIGAVGNVIQTDTSIDASGGTVYGYLIDSIFDVSGETLFVLIADSTGQTLSGIALGDGGAANWGDGTEGVLIKMPVAASTTNPAFATGVFPNGIIYATQIEVSADGDEGTNPTANDVRVYVVYRTDTEVRTQ